MNLLTHGIICLQILINKLGNLEYIHIYRIGLLLHLRVMIQITFGARWLLVR